MITSRALLVLSLLHVLMLGAVGPLHGEESIAPVKIVLHPAAEPRPALKYRLLPRFVDQIPGNAAVYYGKVAAEEMGFFSDRALWDKIEDVWPEMPLKEIRREDMQLSSWPMYYLEEGAKCTYCDWQLPIGREPFYRILLPEAQESRRNARMLAVKARREIADGEFDNAIQTFQTNYALARNVAEGESLVNGLIGIAMCGHMFPQITEFVQQPGSPNLYWALTALPRPLIGMRDAVDVESNALELSFSELRDLEHTSRTPAEWKELFQRFAKQVTEWTAVSDPPTTEPKSPDELEQLCRQIFPTAKQLLIDRGLSPAKVNATSLHQVVLLYTLMMYHKFYDDGAKYFSLPYAEAIQGINAAIGRADQISNGPQEIIPIASHALKALRTTRNAVARNDRQIAVLRVFEALRLHAAANDRQLPQRLSDVTIVPVPDDPVTGRPFEYRVADGKALLTGPPLPHAPLNYEITMQSP